MAVEELLRDADCNVPAEAVMRLDVITSRLVMNSIYFWGIRDSRTYFQCTCVMSGWYFGTGWGRDDLDWRARGFEDSFIEGASEFVSNAWDRVRGQLPPTSPPRLHTDLPSGVNSASFRPLFGNWPIWRAIVLGRRWYGEKSRQMWDIFCYFDSVLVSIVEHTVRGRSL